MERIVTDEAEMKDWASTIGALLRGGELLELIGDVGAGKTTFTKGLASGMSITEVIQSPSYTINRIYENAQGLRLAHYDFYRLSEAGIMAQEIEETSHDQQTVTVVEWAEVVTDVLSSDRLQLTFQSLDENTRRVTVEARGDHSQKILEQIT